VPKANDSRTPKAPGDWKEAFLEALGEHGMVTRACRDIGIGRTTAYEARRADDAFATAWADISEMTLERMEAEAIRRAVDGVDRAVYYQGEEVGLERQYSDTLLIFLLKAGRPDKYRENISVRHAGGVRVSVPQLDEGRNRLNAVVGLMGAIGVLPSPDATHGHPNGNGHP
jgi:hypothetical protein